MILKEKKEMKVGRKRKEDFKGRERKILCFSHVYTRIALCTLRIANSRTSIYIYSFYLKSRKFNKLLNTKNTIR